VNDIWGGEKLFEWNVPVWEHDLERGLRMLRLAIDTHLITWMRSEMMLEIYGVTEERWRDALERQPHFAISEPPSTPAGPSPRWPPTPTAPAGTATRCRPAASPRSRASPTPTAAGPTPGATSSR
jgi:hypothetical protein